MASTTARGPLDQAVGQRALLGGEREDRSPVVGVAVDVEQPGRGEGAAEALQEVPVAALADVGHGYKL